MTILMHQLDVDQLKACDSMIVEEDTLLCDIDRTSFNRTEFG